MAAFTANDRVAQEYSARTRSSGQKWAYTTTEFSDGIAAGYDPDECVRWTKQIAVDQDRKFVDDDLFDENGDHLALAAIWWLDSVDSDFAYVVEMKANWEKWGSLSAGQVRGVLNCLRAEAIREEPKPFGESFPRIVKALYDARNHAIAKAEAKRAETGGRGEVHGSASILLPVGDKVIRLGIAGQSSRYPGDIHVAEATPYGENGEYYGRILHTTGEANERLDQNPEVIAILRDLESDPSTKIREYSRLMGKCAVCGRQLTNAKSIEAGIGPVCAERVGW